MAIHGSSSPSLFHAFARSAARRKSKASPVAEDLTNRAVVEGVSDWGTSEGAKSTQSMVMLFEKHCTEVATSAQGYVATSGVADELHVLSKAGDAVILLQQIHEPFGIGMQVIAGAGSVVLQGMDHRAGLAMDKIDMEVGRADIRT